LIPGSFCPGQEKEEEEKTVMGDPSERERERAERYCEGGELGRWRLSSLPSQFPTTPFLRVSIAWVLRQAVGQCHEQV